MGAPHCSKPHSPEQLEEWRARLRHREQRKRTGAHFLGQVSPNLDNQRNSLPISNIPVCEKRCEGVGGIGKVWVELGMCIIM